MEAVTRNLYFYEGTYETSKALAGSYAFGVPAAMLPLLLTRLIVSLIHKPSKVKGGNP